MKAALACFVLAACASRAPAPPPVPPPEPQPLAAATDDDRDHDRIADRCDECPNEPETYNGVLDDDGCPDPAIDHLTARFGPWGVGFSAGVTPEDDPQSAIAQIVHDDAALWTHGVELVGCRAADEPAELATRRAEWLRDLVRAKGVDAARIALAATPCDASGFTFPHARWVLARPIAIAPTGVGCPPRRPRLAPGALPEPPADGSPITEAPPPKPRNLHHCKAGTCFYPGEGCIVPASTVDRHGTGRCSSCDDRGECISTR